MNQAASYLASQGELQKAVDRKGFKKLDKEITSRKKDYFK